MTETTPTHPEDPAEGADTTGTDTTGTDGAGRTPHPDQPAEGGDPDTEQRASDGLDPENRVTGI